MPVSLNLKLCVWPGTGDRIKSEITINEAKYVSGMIMIIENTESVISICDKVSILFSDASYRYEPEN